MSLKIAGPEDLQPTFAALVEEAFFVELGVANPPLTEYVTLLLVNSLRPHELFSPRELATRHISDVADEIAHTPPPGMGDAGLPHRRQVFRQAGDFVLFWVGLYPEQVASLNKLASDPVDDFRMHGQRFYRHAAELTEDDDQPPHELLSFLSAGFPLCEEGLHVVRRGFEQLRRAG